jgi:hypothetical protein
MLQRIYSRVKLRDRTAVTLYESRTCRIAGGKYIYMIKLDAFRPAIILEKVDKWDANCGLNHICSSMQFLSRLVHNFTCAYFDCLPLRWSRLQFSVLTPRSLSEANVLFAVEQQQSQARNNPTRCFRSTAQYNTKTGSKENWEYNELNVKPTIGLKRRSHCCTSKRFLYGRIMC